MYPESLARERASRADFGVPCFSLDRQSICPSQVGLHENYPVYKLNNKQITCRGSDAWLMNVAKNRDITNTQTQEFPRNAMHFGFLAQPFSYNILEWQERSSLHCYSMSLSYMQLLMGIPNSLQ